MHDQDHAAKENGDPAYIHSRISVGYYVPLKHADEELHYNKAGLGYLVFGSFHAVLEWFLRVEVLKKPEVGHD